MFKLNLTIIIFLILGSTYLFPQNARIETQYVWRDNGARIDWAKHGHKYIAYDFKGTDGFYDWLISDFEHTYIKDLTKSKTNIPQRDQGNASFHPQNSYIIYQAVKDSALGGDENLAWYTQKINSKAGRPGKGFDNDLWCVDMSDTSFYRLTTLPTKKTTFDTTKITGILHPHFSHDGTKVLWAHLIDGAADIGNRGNWGLWQLNVSDFVVNTGIPVLENTREFKPGGILGNFTFCESHDWAKNDSLVIFCMNSEGQHETHIDIYSLNIYDSTLLRLTDESKIWDEHAQVTGDGKHLIWMCSKGYDFDSTHAKETLKADYWLMDLDGNNKEKVTFFNDPAHPDYQIHEGKRVICADASFSAGGDSILIHTKAITDSLTEEIIHFALFDPGCTSSVVHGNNLPEKFLLKQNYPNPFNPQTISIQLSARP